MEAAPWAWAQDCAAALPGRDAAGPGEQPEGEHNRAAARSERKRTARRRGPHAARALEPRRKISRPAVRGQAAASSSRRGPWFSLDAHGGLLEDPVLEMLDGDGSATAVPWRTLPRAGRCWRSAPADHDRRAPCGGLELRSPHHLAGDRDWPSRSTSRSRIGRLASRGMWWRNAPSARGQSATMWLRPPARHRAPHERYAAAPPRCRCSRAPLGARRWSSSRRATRVLLADLPCWIIARRVEGEHAGSIRSSVWPG
jgi:hypothetical protein